MRWGWLAGLIVAACGGRVGDGEDVTSGHAGPAPAPVPAPTATALPPVVAPAAPPDPCATAALCDDFDGPLPKFFRAFDDPYIDTGASLEAAIDDRLSAPNALRALLPAGKTNAYIRRRIPATASHRLSFAFSLHADIGADQAYLAVASITVLSPDLRQPPNRSIVVAFANGKPELVMTQVPGQSSNVVVPFTSSLAKTWTRLRVEADFTAGTVQVIADDRVVVATTPSINDASADGFYLAVGASSSVGAPSPQEATAAADLRFDDAIAFWR